MMHVSEVKHKSQIKMRELVELWPLTLCPLHEKSFDEVHKPCLRSQADPPVEPTPRPACAHIHKYFSRADDEDGTDARHRKFSKFLFLPDVQGIVNDASVRRTTLFLDSASSALATRKPSTESRGQRLAPLERVRNTKMNYVVERLQRNQTRPRGTGRESTSGSASTGPKKTCEILPRGDKERRKNTYPLSSRVAASAETTSSREEIAKLKSVLGHEVARHRREPKLVGSVRREEPRTRVQKERHQPTRPKNHRHPEPAQEQGGTHKCLCVVHVSRACAVLRFALLRFASRAALGIHFTSLHFTSLHFTSLHFTSLHFTSLHFTSLHFTSLHFTSLHFVSFRFVSFRFVSFRFVSFRFVSFRFVSFRFVSFRFVHSSASLTHARNVHAQ